MLRAFLLLVSAAHVAACTFCGQFNAGDEVVYCNTADYGVGHSSDERRPLASEAPCTVIGTRDGELAFTCDYNSGASGAYFCPGWQQATPEGCGGTCDFGTVEHYWSGECSMMCRAPPAPSQEDADSEPRLGQEEEEARAPPTAPWGGAAKEKSEVNIGLIAGAAGGAVVILLAIARYCWTKTTPPPAPPRGPSKTGSQFAARIV